MGTDTTLTAAKPEKKHKAPAEHSTLHISKALIDSVAARFGLKGADVRQRLEAALPGHLKALEAILEGEELTKLETEQAELVKKIAARKGSSASLGSAAVKVGEPV